MRRLKIAEEERIEPVIKKLALGNGDASDAERVSHASPSYWTGLKRIGRLKGSRPPNDGAA